MSGIGKSLAMNGEWRRELSFHLCFNLKPRHTHPGDARKNSHGRKGRDGLHRISRFSLAVANNDFSFEFGMCDVGSHSLAQLYIIFIRVLRAVVPTSAFGEN
mmetsp:Transcript_3104/g.4516  ORF Transcript_3104/g.4516 Transcript_3104/m.4516 type:complete len:102 (-) Transcript_3104:146-451(-)